MCTENGREDIGGSAGDVAPEPLQDGMAEGNAKKLERKTLKKSEGLKPHCVYPSSPLNPTLIISCEVSEFSIFLMLKDRDQYLYDRVSILLTRGENETKARLKKEWTSTSSKIMKKIVHVETKEGTSNKSSTFATSPTSGLVERK